MEKTYKEPISYGQALKLLKEAEVVALPTETVYGLAGRIDSQKALEKIFKIKKRPSFDPLIVHCLDKTQAKEYIQSLSMLEEKLWDAFAPGPLTFVFLKNEKIDPLITAHKKTVAFRIPKHPLMRKILKDLQVPVAAPSANFFGSLSPTKASHVIEAFGGSVPVLDGGSCDRGLESTILKWNGESLKLLRPGSLSLKELKNFLKKEKLLIEIQREENSHMPGGLRSHYAPALPFYIVKAEEEKKVHEFIKQKFQNSSSSQFHLQFLHLDSSPELMARNLYHQLRLLSQKKGVIYTQKSSKNSGEDWDAIWDRLDRASTQVFELKDI